MKQEATALNKVNKQHARSHELVARADSMGALARKRGEEQQQQAMGVQAFDLAGLGDDHFAIAESRIDQARSNFNGNWLAVNSEAFIEKHGTIIKHSDVTGLVGGDDEDEVADVDTACQDLLAPGLCSKQLDSNRALKSQYQTLRTMRCAPATAPLR